MASPDVTLKLSVASRSAAVSADPFVTLVPVAVTLNVTVSAQSRSCALGAEAAV